VCKGPGLDTHSTAKKNRKRERKEKEKEEEREGGREGRTHEPQKQEILSSSFSNINNYSHTQKGSTIYTKGIHLQLPSCRKLKPRQKTQCTSLFIYHVSFCVCSMSQCCHTRFLKSVTSCHIHSTSFPMRILLRITEVLTIKKHLVSKQNHILYTA
jgi:hypothetical protein